jgi:hypothetical protein
VWLNVKVTYVFHEKLIHELNEEPVISRQPPVYSAPEVLETMVDMQNTPWVELVVCGAKGSHGSPDLEPTAGAWRVPVLPFVREQVAESAIQLVVQIDDQHGSSVGE